jgi:hypothetical protein
MTSMTSYTHLPGSQNYCQLCVPIPSGVIIFCRVLGQNAETDGAFLCILEYQQIVVSYIRNMSLMGMAMAFSGQSDFLHKSYRH